MVIAEKELIRQMKEAYKTTGYVAARREWEGEDALYIHGPAFVCEIVWENVPADVLGLIAKHLRGLPKEGEAFQIAKKETKTYIHNMLCKEPEVPEGSPMIQAHRTKLRYQNDVLWQKDRNNGMLMIPDTLDALLLDHGRTVEFREDGLYILGAASWVHISARRIETDEPEWEDVTYLGKRAWA